jgi:glycosyltransferase involved in cell wall biosynthesis
MTAPGAARAPADIPRESERFRSLRGIKVALFTGNYNYLKEGANQALNKLVAHLEDRVGATVRVYSPVTATPAFEPQGTLVPVPSIPLPGRSEFRLALGLPRAARDDIRAFAPDLVHVATPDILCTRAQTFALELGLPIVASVHTHFETYCDYYGLGWLRPVVERHLNRFYGRSDMILAPSAAVVADMAARHGADRLRLWGRGVDTELFAPSRRSEGWREANGIGPREIALAFFGRLVLEKGVDRYAEAVRLLHRRGLPVRAVVIGDGPARARMQAALPGAVFTGHLTGEDLATAVASSDVLVNPSLTETFGNVTLEAMAAGLAVAAADAPSTANLIEHGVNGLVSNNDAPSFAEQVGRLVGDAELRCRLGDAARRTALDRTWQRVLDSALDGYRAMFDRKTLRSTAQNIAALPGERTC